MRAPRLPAQKSIKSFSPGRFGTGSKSHIVNHNAFVDSKPTVGDSSTVYNPDGAMQAGPLPNGPPRFVNAPGRSTKEFAPPGETNKRIP